MSREIKFRAWHTGHHNMFYWEDVRQWWRQGGSKLADILDGYDNYVAMQYTGLKDKNGVEIYEGDILAIKGRGGSTPYVNLGGGIVKDDISLRVVCEDKRTHQLCISWPNKEGTPASGFTLQEGTRKRFEVIGNIYENPELLEHS